MSVITQTLMLLRDILFRPGRAFERISQPGWSGFQAAVLIYLFSTIVHSVFYSQKPVDFPSQAGQVFSTSAQRPGQLINHALSLWQWLGAELLWGTFFIGAVFLFLVFFLGILRSRNLLLKLGFALILASLPLVLIACQSSKSIGAPALAGIWAAVVGLTGFGAFRHASSHPTRPLISLFLSVTAVTLFIIPLQITTVRLNWENGYITALYIGGLWTLGLCAAGIRAITGTGLARNVMALLLSLFVGMEMLFSLYLGKLVPENIMKMMFVP